MKKFAYYLPQFHCIPENDTWWGKGFTEWTNVRKAEKLFAGHDQPKVPLGGNYYNLLDPETMRWQAELAGRYHVDGFIFYHYYFKGKKLLEKPAEMLLGKPDIPIRYFFCWANHDWIRSWEGKRELLMKQEYGTEADWEAHFRYLLPFFRDERYEKKGNMPLLLIFRRQFPERDEMMAYLDRRCRESGFDGLCLIETAEEYRKKYLAHIDETMCPTTRYIHLREPSAAMFYFCHSFRGYLHRARNAAGRFLNEKAHTKYLEKYDGSLFFRYMRDKAPDDERYIRGLFFEWDNTPRHKRRGYIIPPPEKALFDRYMDSIRDREYVFINAWNEWAEGMTMEPTESNGCRYLEWIRDWTEKEEKAGRG